VRLFDDAPQLLVDLARHLFGVVGLLGELAPQERQRLVVTQRSRTELLAHPVAHDHLFGDARRLLDVVGRPGRDLAEDDLLGSAAPKRHGQRVHELGLGRQELVLGGQRDGEAERLTTTHDRDLVHGVGVGQEVTDESVTRLVVGGDRLLFLGDEPALLLGPGEDAHDALLELGHGDDPAAMTGGEQGRLVDEVGQVGAGEPGGLRGKCIEVDLLLDGLAARMDLEDLAPAGAVRPVDHDLTVEPARPQQRRVEDVGTVGGGDEDDVVLHLEAVHLDEQLVEGLLALVVAAAQAGATMPTDGVDLVHEDDARRVLLGLLEQVAHARGADPDEHLDEVGTRDAEEGHARLAGDRPGEQGLAGARRAVEQDPLGDARPELLELLRVLEELLDLLELLDGLVHAGHVLERDSGRVGAHPAGAALAEAHDLGATTLHLVHDEDPEADHQDERQDERQGARPPRVARTCGRELDAGILDELRRLVGARILDLVGDGVAVGILLGGRHL